MRFNNPQITIRKFIPLIIERVANYDIRISYFHLCTFIFYFSINIICMRFSQKNPINMEYKFATNNSISEIELLYIVEMLKDISWQFPWANRQIVFNEARKNPILFLGSLNRCNFLNGSLFFFQSSTLFYATKFIRLLRCMNLSTSLFSLLIKVCNFCVMW